jgi:tetratricopeptide (TPR) repeat protein
VWTPLHLAAEANFVNRSGLLNFANSYMNQTVECKFLQSAEAKKAVHFSLASFFEAQAGFSPRKAKELPWQYKKTEEWEHLWICLCDFQYLKTSWKRSEYDVCRFWREVEQATSHRLGDAYKNLIENPFEDISAAIIAGQIFMKSGYNKQSNSLRQKVSLAVNLIQRLHPQQTDQLQQYVLAGTLHEEAQALNSLGLFQEAIDRLNEAETIARAAYQWDTLLYVLNEKCDLLLETGKVDQAILFINEGITIAREQQKSDLLSGFLQQLAHAERLQGNLNAAHTALSQAEDIMRSRGNLRGLAQILGDRGLLFTRQGRYKEAWSCHEKEGAISRDLNEQHGIESSLFGQVNILKELGEYARALYLMEQVETLYKLSGNFNSLAKCFGTKAAILQEQGKYAEAIEWHIKEETMFREMGNTEGLVIALTNQAILLGYRLGQHDKAMTLAKEALGYAKSGGQVSLTKQIEGLLKSLTNQTKI